MPVLFFEGFNNAENDIPKLDPSYWSTNNLSNIIYGAGRTDNCIYMASRPQASGTGLNTTLTLSNFSDPLLTNNCFGLGFALRGHIATETGSAPANAKWLTFFRSGVPVLDLDFVKTTYSGTTSIGIAVRQNNTTVKTYDLKSVNGASWYNGVAPFPEEDPLEATNYGFYFEIFVDAKTNNRMLIRLTEEGGTINGLLKNNDNSIYTSISGFNALSSIRFYNKGDASILGGGGLDQLRGIDDLYLSGSGTADNTLIGYETKINRILPEATTSISGWISNNGNPISALSTADGDTSYIYTDLNTSGTQSLYEFTDIPSSSPTGLILVKTMNIARKTSLESNSKFINIMRSGTTGTITELGNSYTVSGSDYVVLSSFIYNNPVTGSGWKLSEINNMQIGVKSQGTGV